jgi:hypothetical protein
MTGYHTVWFNTKNFHGKLNTLLTFTVGPAMAQAVTGLSQQRPGFAPESGHVGFMVDKMAR